METTKQRSYSLKFKLDAIAFAEQNNNSAAGRKFGVDRRRIVEWRGNKDKIESAQLQPTPGSRKRLQGGGRRQYCQDLDSAVFEWILEQRNQ